MTTLVSVLPVVISRIAANWRLLLAVVIGAVIAAALMSTTSIYTDAIRDLGLSYAIRQEGPDKTNILIRASSQQSRKDLYLDNRQFIDDVLKKSLGPLLAGENWAGRGATFFPTAPGGAVSTEDSRPRSHIQFISGYDHHVRVVEGRLPAAATAADGGVAPTIEVAIGEAPAKRSNVRIGSQFDLHPFWAPDAAPVKATVVGIVAATDADEPYWLGLDDFFDFHTPGWETLPFFVEEATFTDAVVSYLPTMTSDFWSLAYVHAGRIDARNAANILRSLRGLDQQLQSNLERTTMISELPNTLDTFDQKLFFTRIPLLVLLIQVAAIVLYYLFMVSTMLVERQSAEIALLKSRGATTTQVMQIYLIEGGLVALAAMLIGPPFAAGVISLLGKTPPFTDLSGSSYLHVTLSDGAYLWAFSGAILAFVALIWPAYQATKHTMVQQRAASARPPRQSTFTRYYLDLALVALGAILLFQLNRRGTLVTEKLFGDQTADPVMLLTPALFILTVGIFFLRVFPWVLRVFAYAVGRAQGTAVLIGTWQLVRNPTHYSRLVLLLMLATAVGMFAASFGATIERSYQDRAAYVAGAPLRLEAIRRIDSAGPVAITADAASRYGATAASPVARIDGSQGSGFERTSFDMLAIDPASFSKVAYFRGDYADESLGAMLNRLAKDREDPPGLVLPADARWLGVWVSPTNLNGRVGFFARVTDADGRYFNVVLGPASGSELGKGWSFAAGDLTRPEPAPGPFSDAPPKPPLRLQSVAIRFFTLVSAYNGAAAFDDIQVSASASLPATLTAERIVFDPARTQRGFPDGRIVADLDDLNGWEILKGVTPDPLQDEIRRAPAGASGNAAELVWRPTPLQANVHGLLARTESRPVAVFASDAFLEKARLSVGDKTPIYIDGTYVSVEVVGRFRLFPTLADTRNAPALIANGNRLLIAANLNPRGSPRYVDELWLQPGPDSASRVAADIDGSKLTANVVSYAALRDAQEKDPLIAAGWEGILFISFAAILMLSAFGFLIYSYLTAQKRTLDFAVLRTMGFSRRQVATVVGFEQLFVVGLGVLAGTLMGLRLGRLMIKYMGVTETGKDVLPPMILHVSWLTVGTAYLVLGLVFLVTIGIVVLLYSRLALHRVLRIGET